MPNKATHLSSEDFIASSIIRFGGHSNYIQEKLTMDYFVIEGNLGISRGLRIYLKNQAERLKKLKQIHVLDIGSAIGALTALLTLQELGHAGLLSKTKLTLVDVSERVIDQTQSRNFAFPHMLIDSKFKTQIFSKLRTAKGIVASAQELPIKDERIDICTAGFLFNHLHDHIKKPVAKEMQRVTKTCGFMGIAEKWFDDQEAYAALHQYDEIPLAYESAIPYRKLRKLFPHLEIFDSHNPIRRAQKSNDNYYYICGIIRGKGRD